MIASASSSTAADGVLTALRNSHARLAATLSSIPDEKASAPSYAAEWSIGQVASHLGSGAEIFGLILDAGIAGGEAPGQDQLQPIWSSWNAKDAPSQARDALLADAAFIERIEALPAESRNGWQLDLFGGPKDFAGLLRMRLGEHSLHTWDIVVMSDPAATVSEDAAGELIDTLDFLVARVSKGVDRPATVQVTTSAPDRSIVLELGTGGATLLTAGAAEAGASATATLDLPGESFVRLVYGRLDPEHTPSSVQVEGVDLSTLRQAFPGF